MPASRGKRVTLLAVLAVTSCASPPRPTVQDVQRTWEETMREWDACRRGQAESLEGDERDDYLGHHSEVMANLHLRHMVAILHTISDDEWHGEVRIEGEMRAGAPVTVRLATCPPGRRFALYSCPDLANPLAHPSGNHDYWVLDLKSQRFEAEGTVDSRGEATVTVSLPSDPSLAGSFRGFQATILKDGAAPGGATVGFTMAHGRRVR